jgi:hypothetical protein
VDEQKGMFMHHNGGSVGERDSGGARHSGGDHGGHPLDGIWPPYEGGGQPDEIELSPQALLIALHDKHGWYATVWRNRKMRILTAIIWAYLVAHGAYLIVSYLFFSHR